MRRRDLPGNAPDARSAFPFRDKRERALLRCWSQLTCAVGTNCRALGGLQNAPGPGLVHPFGEEPLTVAGSGAPSAR